MLNNLRILFLKQLIGDEVYKRAENNSIVLILKPSEISENQRMSGNFKFQEAIEDKNKNIAYEVWRM
jgi:hypothetical protein